MPTVAVTTCSKQKKGKKRESTMQLLLLLQDAAAGRVVVRKSLCYATRRARAEQLQQPEQRVRYPSDPRPRSINTRHTLYPAVLYTPCIIEGTSTVGHINVVVVYCCCCCRPTVVSSKRKKNIHNMQSSFGHDRKNYNEMYTACFVFMQSTRGREPRCYVVT